MDKKNKILISGGCGYIGSHTIIELIDNTNYDIISIDNNINSTEESLEKIFRITGKKIKNYKVDLCHKGDTEKVFKENPDLSGIIHFAALKSVPDSVNNPLLYYHNNLESLTNILELADQNKVENFIFSSSCSVYGNVKEIPVTESSELQKAESPYGHTKQIGEDIIRNFSVKSKVNSIALRYFNPVGAHVSGLIGESPLNKPNNLVPVITKTATGEIEKLTVYGGNYETRDGTCIRDYVHVSDIANAHLQALKFLMEGRNEESYEIFNLGTGHGITVLEAIKAFEKVSGLCLNYEIGDKREGDVAAIFSNSDKAYSKFGWKTTRDIEDMMASAWKWEQNLKKSNR